MIRRTRSAIVETLCESTWDRHLPSLAPPYRDAVAYVERSLDAMPDIMRRMIHIATWVFALSAIIVVRKPFDQVSASTRHRFIETWRTSRISWLRDFVRLHDALCLVALYERADFRKAV